MISNELAKLAMVMASRNLSIKDKCLYAYCISYNMDNLDDLDPERIMLDLSISNEEYMKSFVNLIDAGWLLRLKKSQQ
jgi:hypothetical protein